MEELKTRPLFSKEQILRRVEELGKQIAATYPTGDLVIVSVLKGAFIFTADLVRAIDRPCQVEFIGVSSYEGTSSTGRVRITNDLTKDIKDKHILLVEDIIDTGRTIDYLLEVLKVRKPSSLRVCTFLSKPEAHIMQHQVDFIGFEISKEFVVGYGLDLDGYYRNLDHLAQVIE